MFSVDEDDVLERTMLIDDEFVAERAVAKLWGVPKCAGERFLAVDVEGVGLGSYSGRATLVQIASHTCLWGDANIFVFDVLSCPSIWSELRGLLQTQEIIKVFHNCRSDLFAIQQQENIRIGRMYDTGIADYVIRWQENPGANASRRSLNDVVLAYGAGRVPRNDLGDYLPHCYRSGREVWAERPLTHSMLSYAAADADILWKLYKRIRSLVRRGRAADLMWTMIWEMKNADLEPAAVRQNRRHRERERSRFRSSTH